MKKVIIALLIALIIPCCVFAGRGLFDFTVGVAAQSDYDVATVRDEGMKDFSIDQLSFGADVEMKLAFVAIDGKVMYAPEIKTIGGTISANLALDIFFVRVKAGLGYQYQYNFDTKAMSYGNTNGSVTAFADFKDACFDLNFGADLLLGNLTVGAYATLPTDTSIANKNWDGLFGNIKDNWSKAKLGMVIGIALL
ncbi:MAG: hypothetical protein J5800_06360 [Spirochaetales bacterium]|nr:hypothetical protein [Spirochaetales bacterium]